MNFDFYRSLVEAAKKVNDVPTWINNNNLVGCPYGKETLKKCMEIIYDVAHGDAKKIIVRVGSLKKFEDKFGIGRPTVAKWSAGRRTPLNYTIELIGFVLITDLLSDDRAKW